MRNKKSLLGFAVMTMFSAAASGCIKTDAADFEGFQKVVDEYAKITLRMDAESALVDAAYASVEKYLEDPNLDQLQETAGEVEHAFRQLYDQYTQMEEYKMPEEISELIEEYDIFYEDFMTYASEEKTQVVEYILDLGDVYEYLSYEATDLPLTEELAFFFDILNQCQKINCNYMYTSINYWFAGRSEKELAYVEEAVTDRLISFCSDGHEWDKNQADVEDRLNAYLDEIADLRLDWKIYLGEQQAEINQMKQELEGEAE